MTYYREEDGFTYRVVWRSGDVGEVFGHGKKWHARRPGKQLESGFKTRRSAAQYLVRREIYTSNQ